MARAAFCRQWPHRFPIGAETKSGVAHCKLDKNGPKFRRLTGPTQRGLATKFFQLFLSSAARHLKRCPNRTWHPDAAIATCAC
jgi:hypothetical protein